jgi:hypothetical protein
MIEGQGSGRVQLSKTSDFSVLAASEEISGSGTRTADLGVLDAGDYFWRAIRTDGGTPLASASRSFKVGRLALGPATFALHVGSSCSQFDRKDYSFSGNLSLTADGARFDASPDAAGVDFSATLVRSTSGPTISIAGRAHQQFGLSSEYVDVQASQSSTAAVVGKSSVDMFGAASGSFSGFVRMVLGTVSAGGAICAAPDHSYSLSMAPVSGRVEGAFLSVPMCFRTSSRGTRAPPAAPVRL